MLFTIISKDLDNVNNFNIIIKLRNEMRYMRRSLWKMLSLNKIIIRRDNIKSNLFHLEKEID